jgi:hypothetical protein
MRKKNYDKMNPSERILYAFKRSQGVADIFKTVSEQDMMDAELAQNAQFTTSGMYGENDGENDPDNAEAGMFEEGYGGGDMRAGASADVLGEDDDEMDRDNF